MYIYIHSYIYNYNLYNVTWVYVLRADHLVVDNKLVCLSLKKTISPSPSIRHWTQRPLIKNFESLLEDWL